MNKSSDYKEFRELCQAHGCRCTPQRLEVYSYMKDNRSHPDVNRIWGKVSRSIPTITRESVFRILMELAEFGVINRMDKITDARFDGRVYDHGHLICERCGSVVDFDLPPVPLLSLDMHGFTTRHTELRISGLCESCAAADDEHAKPGEQDRGTEMAQNGGQSGRNSVCSHL